MLYEISPGNVGCMSCGSSNCGLFTCYTVQPATPYEIKFDLRREAENRVGRYEPRYEVKFGDQEGHYANRQRFFSWSRARYAARHFDDMDGEIHAKIWDRELRLDVTSHPNPSSRWPRWGHGPRNYDDLPF